MRMLLFTVIAFGLSTGFGKDFSNKQKRNIAVTHCAQVIQEAVAKQANEDIIKSVGEGNSVSSNDVVIADYSEPTNSIAIVGFGTLGGFAYRVKSHYENETICVADKVTPAVITISKKIKDIKL